MDRESGGEHVTVTLEHGRVLVAEALQQAG